jgi:dihydroflavonol-4-reductase
MEPSQSFWSGKRVCVTGGTGFLGWHLVQQLDALGARVRVFGLRPASRILQEKLQRFDCIKGDIRDAALVRDAIRNCAVVFHTAGTVATWGPAVQKMYEIHTLGTRHVLDALAPGARMVHTSSITAVNAEMYPRVQTEDAPFQLQSLKADYPHAKRAAEEIALGGVENGRDVMCVNPGYLIGPEDYENSVMGRFCVRFWRGKVPLIPPGGMSFVDVRDVARGHLLAAERGQTGRRYILGGANLTMYEFARQLAVVAGRSMRWCFSMPRWLLTVLAWGAEARAALNQRPPYPSRQESRLTRYYWYVSSERAILELGFSARPVEQSLRDAFRCFCERGILKVQTAQETANGMSKDARRAA